MEEGKSIFLFEFHCNNLYAKFIVKVGRLVASSHPGIQVSST